MSLSHTAFLTLFAVAVITPSALAQECGEWASRPSPNPGSVSNLLIDVAAASPDEAISVGHWADPVLARRPMVVRWDGSAWSSVSLPDTSHLGTSPNVEGVGRTPDGHIWVVGYVRTGYPTDQLPLLMQWRDGEWDSAATPVLRPQTVYPFAARGGVAYDAVGLSANDVWVVGSAVGYGDASATSIGMALHFDGSTWEDVPVPLIANRHHELRSVSASASDNVWAVGDSRNIAAPFKAFIVRFDGTSWSRVPSPGDGPGDSDAQAVLALAPDDVWVSGSFNNGTVHLIHWNGSEWELPAADIPGVIASFAAFSPNDIWASNATSAAFYHYDGATWSAQPSPVIPGSSYVLRGWGMDTFGPCAVWSVGGYSDGTTQFTLAEQLGPTTCAADFDGNSTIGVPDIFAFLSAWFASDSRADIDGTPGLGVPDIFAFLSLWFAGC